MFGGKEQADSLAGPASAMREGYRLTLSRLEAALLQWGIQRTGEVGEPFDPRRMAVVEVGTAPGVPDGSVLEVYRSGYVLDGHVLATARVKVAKAGVSR
jgi:molecular chaperone GrpE (heat shock protein)